MTPIPDGTGSNDGGRAAEQPPPTATTTRPTARRPFSGAAALRNGVPHAFLVVWALLVLVPLAWLVMSTFKTNQEIYTNPFELPDTLRFFTYAEAWTKASIGSFFINTVIVVVFGVLLTLFLSSMVAYVLARYPFRGSRLIYYLFLAGMAFPIFLAIVPLVRIAQSLGLYQNLPGLIIIYVAFSLPFSVFFLTAFFQTLPEELAESAYLDGAGHYRTFFSIMLPLAKPGLLSIGVFNFLGQWNQYLLPLVLNPPDESGGNMVLTQGLANLALSERYESSATSIAEMCAGLVITMLPVLVVYIVFQRRVEEGLTAGALK